MSAQGCRLHFDENNKAICEESGAGYELRVTGYGLRVTS